MRIKTLDRWRLPSQITALFLAMLCCAPSTSRAEGAKLEVVGYGVKACPAYLEAFQGWDDGVDEGILEYARYREWLAGLVTGLTLALGEDVLQGIGIESAMRRIRVDCEEQRESDFFGASMRLVRILSDRGEAPKE